MAIPYLVAAFPQYDWVLIDHDMAFTGDWDLEELVALAPTWQRLQTLAMPSGQGATSANTVRELDPQAGGSTSDPYTRSPSAKVYVPSADPHVKLLLCTERNLDANGGFVAFIRSSEPKCTHSRSLIFRLS